MRPGRKGAPAVAFVLVLALALVGVAGCGNDLGKEADEGVPIQLGQLKITVQETRFLNPAQPDDKDYLVGQPLPVPPSKAYLGVFLTMHNSGDSAVRVPAVGQLSVTDTTGAAYPAVPSSTPFAAPLGTVLAGHAGLPAAAPRLGGGLSLTTPGTFARMSPTLVALGLVVVTAGVWLGVRFSGAARGLRVGDTWGCGSIAQTARMEYTSTAFAEPFRRVFAELYRPTKDLSIDFHPDSRYFVQSIEYRSEIVPWVERYLYAPVIERVERWAVRARAIQSGSAHAYLTYLVIALLGLLTILLVRGA